MVSHGTRGTPVWSGSDRSGRGSDANVGGTERVLSAVGGGLLALFGLGTRDTFTRVGLPLVGGYLVYRGLSGHCPAYAALDIRTSRQHGAATAVPAGAGVRVEHSVTINKPADELFRFWRQFDRLPQFMSHLQEVRILEGTRSHWVAKAPLGFEVAWDAEIIQEKPNELIAWRSMEGADVDNAGSVHFSAAPGGRGTVVRVSLKYNPPAGKLGAAVARLFGESPEVQVREDLSRFKRLMETGELPTVAGQTSGRR